MTCVHQNLICTDAVMTEGEFHVQYSCVDCGKTMRWRKVSHAIYSDSLALMGKDKPPVNLSKRCTKCGETKPATTEYFYRSKSSKDSLGSWCINCKIESSLNQGAYTPNAKDAGESIALQLIKEQGIAAHLGKEYRSAFKWVDIVAWGCVKIEVKYSEASKWGWGMRSTNNPDTPMPDIIMLLGKDVKTNRVYTSVLAFDNPLFYTDKGTRKANVTYNYKYQLSIPQVDSDHFRNGMDNFGLIETFRLKWKLSDN